MLVSEANAHIKACNQYAQSCEDAFFRACFIAVTSMRLESRVFWRNVQRQYAMLDPVKPDWSLLITQFRFGYKERCLSELHSRRAELCQLAQNNDSDALHDALCTVHGLQGTKAGFIVQMATGDLGCFDAVHCARAGISQRQFASISGNPPKYRAFIAQFDWTRMWRDWCVHTANRDRMDARLISEAHAHFIGSGKTLLPWFFNWIEA